MVLVSARQPTLTRQWTPRHSCVAQSPFTCAQCQLCLCLYSSGLSGEPLTLISLCPAQKNGHNSQSCCPSGKGVARCVCDVCDGTEQKAEKSQSGTLCLGTCQLRHFSHSHSQTHSISALGREVTITKLGRSSCGRFASAPFVICVGTFCILVMWSGLL